jgi:regulator of sigma E protease
MNIVFGVILGILILTLVVTIHEFGHFIVAKRNGVKVNEFGIGFPPKAKTWLHVPVKEAAKYCKRFKLNDVITARIIKKAERRLKRQTRNKKKWIWIPLPKDEWYEEVDGEFIPKKQDYLVFSLNYLPIGGFCAMDGETNIDTRPGTFGASSFWSKTKILFAGVTFNWLLAFVIFTVLAWLGTPEFFENQFRFANDTETISTSSIVIHEVVKDSPAEKAKLQKDDVLLEARYENDVTKIETSSALTNFNRAHAGQTVTYKVRRIEEVIYDCDKAPCPSRKVESERTIDATLNNTDAEYLLGITMTQNGQTRYRSTWSAPVVGLVNTVQLTGETYRGIGMLFANLFSGIVDQFNADETVRSGGQAKIQMVGDSVTGPVGIIGVIFPAFADTGLVNILFLAAMISVSLACMNVLPIPALDGGRWLLIAIYRALKRPLTPETENKIVSRAFMVLLALAAVITILDIFKILR